LLPSAASANWLNLCRVPALWLPFGDSAESQGLSLFLCLDGGLFGLLGGGRVNPFSSIRRASKAFSLARSKVISG
jgi:hypothetical protein